MSRSHPLERHLIAFMKRQLRTGKGAEAAGASEPVGGRGIEALGTNKRVGGKGTEAAGVSEPVGGMGTEAPGVSDRIGGKGAAASGEALLVAISGGIDSTALLMLLHATRDRHGRPIVAGHVNHGVRPDADDEEKRLEALCGRLGVPFRSARLNLRKGHYTASAEALDAADPSDAPSGSRPAASASAPSEASPPSEAAMRKARYAALSKLARASNCAWVLLAHQRDDQAETFLLNLTRGAGIAGLAGMPVRRGIFLRPLLDVPRSALRRYLEDARVASVEDPGNLDLARSRNLVRHRVLPLLESEVRPRSAERIARAAGSLRRALDALDAQAAQLIAKHCLPAVGRSIRLDAAAIRPYPEGLVERILYRAVRTVRGNTSNIHAETWRSMTRSLMRAGDARFLLPGGVRVDLRGKTVEIAPAPARRTGEASGGQPDGMVAGGAGQTPSAGGGHDRHDAIPPDPIDLEWTGDFAWGTRGRIRTEIRSITPMGQKLRIRGLTRVQVFDADLVRPPFRVRPARRGDFLDLEDSAGSRKLSDLLSERMVPRSLRAEQPVLEDAGGILWAPGIRRAGRALVHRKTERIWIVRWSGDLPVDQAAHGGSAGK